jgi:MFS transporter, ACDE family, multidrug resistance protein
MSSSRSPLIIWIIAAIPLVMVLGNSMLVPVLPEMETKLKISQFQISLMITAFSFAAGLVIPFVGYLSDKFGRKIIIVPALLLYGIGGIIAGVAAWLMKDSYLIILAGRIVQGIGAAGTAPIAMAYIGDEFSGKEESRALGLIEATNGLGKVVSPIIGALIALLVWYAVFFVFPVLCFLLAAAGWFIIKESQPPQAKPLKQYLQSIGQIFKEKGKWLIPSFFAGSIALFILFGVLFYLSDILESDYRIVGIKKGLILAIPLMGMVTTSYTTGATINQDKKTIRKVLLVGLMIMTVSLFLVAFFKQKYMLIGLLTLNSIGTGLLLPCLNILITGAIQSSERGMITSLYNCLRFIGVAIGPPIFGWLMGISHKVMFFSVAGLAGLISILAFVLIRPAGQQKGTKGGGNSMTKPRAATIFKKIPAK